MPYFQELHYETHAGNSGRHVLLFHGLSADYTIVEPIAVALNEKGFNTFTFDYFGHGGTRAKGNLKKFSKIIRNFLDEKKICNIDVIGYSLGGFNARVFAEDNIDVVNKVVLISSYLGNGIEILKVAPRLLFRFFIEGNILTYKRFIRFLLVKCFYDNTDPKISSLYNSLIKTHKMSVIKAFCEILSVKETTSLKNKQVFCIHGYNDKLISFNMANKYSRYFTDKLILNNAGHMLPAEKPNDLNSGIIHFLSVINR